MKYLFFDIECCDGAHICEFGYVLTNDKFEILDRDFFLINPEKEFNLTGRKDQRDLQLHFSEEEYGSPLYIISNIGGCMGASAILAENKLKELANRLHASKLVVLPSSVHEMIVLPYTGEETVEQYSRLVKSVNATEVEPEERLTDRAYIISI